MVPMLRPAELDVRDMLCRGEEPFGVIMQAVAALGPGQALRLVAPFRPLPLIALMEERGYNVQLIAMQSGDFEVLFTPTA